MCSNSLILITKHYIVMHETSFTYQLKKNQLIEVPGSF
jgi:hypothetical protein